MIVWVIFSRSEIFVEEIICKNELRPILFGIGWIRNLIHAGFHSGYRFERAQPRQDPVHGKGKENVKNSKAGIDDRTGTRQIQERRGAHVYSELNGHVHQENFENDDREIHEQDLPERVPGPVISGKTNGGTSAATGPMNSNDRNTIAGPPLSMNELSASTRPGPSAIARIARRRVWSCVLFRIQYRIGISITTRTNVSPAISKMSNPMPSAKLSEYTIPNLPVGWLADFRDIANGCDFPGLSGGA